MALRSARVRRGLLALGVWALVAVPVAAYAFTHSSAPMVLAGHDVVVTPTFDGRAVLEMGPYLPDVRVDSGRLVGVRIRVGKTTASSANEIVSRYAVLASHPEPEVRRLVAEVGELGLDAIVRGAVAGLVPLGLWLLVGTTRRRELVAPPRGRIAVAGVLVVALVVIAVEPWRPDGDKVQPSTWIPLATAIPQLEVPTDLKGIEVQGGVITKNTRRLVQSAFDTYAKSRQFYRAVEAMAPSIAEDIRRPGPGETTGVLVSDRHDNVGMDQVVAAVAKQAEAEVVIDAGDDTSTGSPWEAFSLDSLDEAFHDYPVKLAIAGNHDHGTFVARYLADLGWKHLEGKPIEPFGGVRILGVDDPRSSGLGSWVDDTGVSYAVLSKRLSDELCRLDDEDERVATVVVHSASMAQEALRRGCVDLVVGGHLHVQVGPDRIVGENGRIGYRYTNGTTGGAAYAFALGSKLRRNAEFTLLTWRNGRPIGIQPVVVNTRGQIEVKPYVALRLGEPPDTDARRRVGPRD